MKRQSLLASLLTSACVILPGPLWAQTAPAPSPPASEPDATTLDEIVVTATKRSQTLQDVPISVAVTSAEAIREAHIVDLKDLQSIVPSLKVQQQQSAGATNFIIRGFGNGSNNDGIEGSVGVFIDGVYRSRSAAAIDDLPEIERIEVLRGPQSTLFGKNVSAGAISIATRRPSFEWGGRADLTVGDYGLINPRFTVTGPLSDDLAFRVSGSLNQRDGYFTNTVTGKDANALDRWSVRGDLLYQPTDALSVRVIADYNKIDELCCGVTSAVAGPATALIRSLGYTVLDPASDYDIVPDQDSTNEIIGKGVSAQVDLALGWADLTSITAYRVQTNAASGDVDYTSAAISVLDSANEIKTFTQEVRLASTGDGPLSWLVGAFYDREDLQTGRDLSYGADTRRFVDALSGGLVGVLEAYQNAVDPSIVPGQAYFAPGLAIADNYALTQTSFSVFGQTDYKIGRLTLTAGLAYLDDRKEASSDVVLADRFSALNLENVPQFAFLPFAALPPALSGCLLQKGYNPAANGGTIPVNLFGATLGGGLPGAGFGPCPASPAGSNPFALNGLQFFYGDTTNHGPVNYPNADESGVLDGSKVTYALRAAYDFGSVNTYVSYSTGWKAGAYNLSSDSRPPVAAGLGRSAGPEEVEVWELGAKALIPGGFINLAVFDQSIDGFQANAFNGLNYSLVNAGRESVQGFELDASWSPAPWITLTAATTYLDAVFDSFTQAPCVGFDTVRCPVDPATGRTPPFRDLTGERPAGVPEWTTSLGVTLRRELAPGWSGAAHADYQYVSETEIGGAVPGDLKTYGGEEINASLSLEHAASGLSVLFWGRNLTDAHYPVGIFPATLQAGSYSQFPNQPRTYGLTFSKTF